jgi:DNA-directed RNA polymerase subunit beta'
MAERNRVPSEIDSIRIRLASPDDILSWSYGEVTKPETINYRSFKPERDGLFCEKIFGPTKDWECYCGKYKRIRYRGVICDKCGVEVTRSKVRRERLGHISLAVPVSHIWYFKALPSRIGQLIDMSIRNLERILYYESYIVIDPGETPLKQNEILSEDAYDENIDEYGEKAFRAGMGAGAIKELLARIDIPQLAEDLRGKARNETSIQKKKECLKRLSVVESFRNSGNRPEWMVMDVIPVIPPDLRPLVPLEGGRFATSDLNDLYRRVINRNNRLKKLIEIRAPEVILRNEKRMLQEAVDALFDNGRRSRAVRGEGNRPLKSLSDLLKGKQGRFRQNLLGKRVDYSGRSVIVVGPELKINECGLPKNMALELFKPFIIKKLGDEGSAQTVKSAKRLVERERPEVWGILEEIIKDHPVLLNRAPTLHRLGIQAFQPVLIEGKAIMLHPLVCTAFNADFDGDQMAVHVPLSFEAQLEARVLMLASNNILSPATGRPVATASQDIVLGCYYLTKDRDDVRGSGMVFASPEEVLLAHELRQVDVHARVKVWYGDETSGEGELVSTTIGRVVFNTIIPEGFGFVDEVMTKKRLEQLVGDIHRQYGNYQTCLFLDQMKELGFKYSTRGGITVSVDDMVIPEEKERIVRESEAKVEKVQADFRHGAITNRERYNIVIDIWTHASHDVAESMFERLKLDRDGFNPIFIMHDSQARGSKDQIKQLAGMRGLMSKPQKRVTGGIGEIIETPVTSNFREGLSVIEYFISTHGARKGLADTALKTAEAGYLTRRLVDVAQDVIVTEIDCGTILGPTLRAIQEGEDTIESLGDRVLGRVCLDDIVRPDSGETIIEAGTLIDEEQAALIDEAKIREMRIRSVLTCEAGHGVCAHCYGRNLANGRLVDIGEAVGVIAAQSIGEPGTQLTLRTFHIGGIADHIAGESKKIAASPGKVCYENISVVDAPDGSHICTSRNGEVHVEDEFGRALSTFKVNFGSALLKAEGDMVKKGEELFNWDPYSSPILTHVDGIVCFDGIEPGITMVEEENESGVVQRVITDDRERKLYAHIEIVNESGEKMRRYTIPSGAQLQVEDGQIVKAGTILVKVPRLSTKAKTKDITGGLPRVAELFEARHPKEAAIVSEIDGVVEFGAISRGMIKCVVRNDSGDEREYSIPMGKHRLVNDHDVVAAGDPLTEGSPDPHDLLKIKGANELQQYLVNEAQEVYRLQGVRINDKHIEVIVRQMLQKVRVEDPGGTDLLEGQQVDRAQFARVNKAAITKGLMPATSRPLLLGITKASLSTESFVSGASFQETTRVLTDAAVQGKVDHLVGLKENVIMGQLIPAGTGLRKYRHIMIDSSNDDLTDEALGITAVDDLDAYPFASSFFAPDSSGLQSESTPKELSVSDGTEGEAPSSGLD